MSQIQVNAVKDVDFDEVIQTQKKINYKEVFLTLNEGDNLVRFIDLKGKKIGTHWLKDVNGKQREVKCPVAGCPCCKATPPVPIQYKTFMKVVDKLGNVKIFEFGSQIMKQIKSIVADLKQDDANALLTQRDVIITRGARGANPLYNVKLVKMNPKPSPSEQLRQQAIEEAISQDTLNLAEIVTPWTVKRINEYIYGIKEDGTVADGLQTPAQVPLTVDADTSFNFGANTQTAIHNADVKPKSDEDMSMFD